MDWQPREELATPVPSAAVLVTQVGGHYDPMIAKVLARGPDRAAALAALHGVLTELEVRVPASACFTHLPAGCLRLVKRHACPKSACSPHACKQCSDHPGLSSTWQRTRRFGCGGRAGQIKRCGACRIALDRL